MTSSSFYTHYRDRIADKRYDSPHPLRRYVHRLNYSAVIDLAKRWVPDGGKVLDLGCGDGILTVLLGDSLREKQVRVIGLDISIPNVLAATRRLSDRVACARDRERAPPRVHFAVADGEHVPHANETFDLVISSHVLEHLDSLDTGLAEVHRLTRRTAVVALPTCLNLCAAVQLGGGEYWQTRRKDFRAMFIGLLRIARHLGQEGVNEGYAGHESLPHLWRYPWAVRNRLREAGFALVGFEAGSLAIPFLATWMPSLIHAQRCIDRLRRLPFLRNFGYGSIVVLRKT